MAETNNWCRPLQADGNKFYILGSLGEYTNQEIIIPLINKVEEVRDMPKHKMEPVDFHISSPGGDGYSDSAYHKAD